MPKAIKVFAGVLGGQQASGPVLMRFATRRLCLTCAEGHWVKLQASKRVPLKNPLICSLFVLILMLLNLAVYSQDEMLIIELPDVDVEGTRITPPPSSEIRPNIENSAAAVTVIDVDPQSRPLSTASEIVASTAGVSIRRYGGLGDFATISVRGSSISQVNLYLDGVPLSQTSSFFNLGDINAANLERIEIIRGQSPLGFGRSAIGGVINLVPRQSKNELSATFKLTYGSFATKGFNLLATYGGEGYASMLGLGHLQSKGDFSYLDDNGTPLEDNDDKIKTRKNNALDQLDLLGNFSCWGEWGRLKLAHYYFRKHKGMPGISSFQSESAHFTNEFNQASLNYQLMNIFDERLGLDLKGFVSSKVDAFYDPDGDIGIGRTNNRNETISRGGSGLLVFRLPEAYQQLSVFFESIHENYLPSDHLNTQVSESKISRNGTNLVIDDVFSLLDKRIEINPAWRIENSHNSFDGKIHFHSVEEATENYKSYLLTSRSLGIVIKPLSWLKLKGSLAENYRLPNFTELFGSKGTILGNTDLKPEKSYNRDVGIQLQGRPWWFIDSWFVDTGYYLNEVEDLINYEVNSQRTTVARNISEARLEGVEFNGQLGLLKHFKQSLSVTFQQAKDASDIPYYQGKRLPNRPLYEINSHSELYHRKGKVYFDVHQLTRNYLDRANFYQIDNRIIENAGIVLNPYKNYTSISFEVRNLTDDQVEDIAGYPLPGRSYFGSLAVNF